MKARTPLNKISAKKQAANEAAGITPFSTFKKRPYQASPGVKQKRKKAKKGPSTAILDRLFSDYIRRNGECELWGVAGVTCSSQLHCSHIKSRRFLSTRWASDNAICACAAHHRWQHDHPDQNTLELIRLFGQERIDRNHASWLKGDKPDREAIAEWLRTELEEAA